MGVAAKEAAGPGVLAGGGDVWEWRTEWPWFWEALEVPLMCAVPGGFPGGQVECGGVLVDVGPYLQAVQDLIHCCLACYPPPHLGMSGLKRAEKATLKLNAVVKGALDDVYAF